jgi:uncharacterized protein YebE (UPF0316 family)
MDNLIWSLVAILLVNIVSNAIGTLKTVFIMRGISKPAYLLTLVDALIFTWGMKLVISGDGWLFIVVYAVGKMLGVWLGDIIEKKLAFGDLDVTIMAKREKAHQMADLLRYWGYASNSTKTHGIAGEEKWDVRFLVSRREFDLVITLLAEHGFKDISMVINDVTKVTGKITTRRKVGGDIGK